MNPSIPQQPPLEPPPPAEKRKPPALLGCLSLLLAGFSAFAVIVGLTVLSSGLLTYALLAGAAFFAYAFFHYVIWGWWLGDMIRAEVEEEEQGAETT